MRERGRNRQTKQTKRETSSGYMLISCYLRIRENCENANRPLKLLDMSVICTLYRCKYSFMFINMLKLYEQLVMHIWFV